jgi:shikimate kinase
VTFSPSDNLILIGMPGCGKSTLGVLLAKALSRNFVDTDLLIQSTECRRLQEIIEDIGMAAFRTMEERYVLTLDCAGCVIATGGSVVYSEAAMEHLKSRGTAVFIDLPLETIRTRVEDMDSRGVVRAPGQSLDELYAERLPLYRRFADVTVAAEGLTHEQAVQRILHAQGMDAGCRKMK